MKWVYNFYVNVTRMSLYRSLREALILSRRLVPAHVRTETRPIPSEGRRAFSHRRKAIRHLPEEEIIARRTDPDSQKLPPLSFCHQYKQIVKAATLGEEEESRPSTSGTGHGTIGKWERSLGRELAERQDKTRSGQGGTSGPGPWERSRGGDPTALVPRTSRAENIGHAPPTAAARHVEYRPLYSASESFVSRDSTVSIVGLEEWADQTEWKKK